MCFYFAMWQGCFAKEPKYKAKNSMCARYIKHMVVSLEPRAKSGAWFEWIESDWFGDMRTISCAYMLSVMCIAYVNKWNVDTLVQTTAVMHVIKLFKMPMLS